MESKNELNFLEQIDDLYKLHYVTKKFNHKVEYPENNWKLFEPSKFIYAFFAFNSFYNFEWNISVSKNNLSDFPEQIKEKKTIRTGESTKFNSMIDFIFENTNETERELFFKIVRKEDEDESNLISVINKITYDDEISESKRSDFKKDFRKLVLEDSLIIGRLKRMMFFIYSVRNNIFHGTKNTIDMTEEDQRSRLIIYSRILIATNELIFKALQNKTSFIPKKSYTIRL